jgi:hypothetical protein
VLICELCRTLLDVFTGKVGCKCQVIFHFYVLTLFGTTSQISPSSGTAQLLVMTRLVWERVVAGSRFQSNQTWGHLNHCFG